MGNHATALTSPFSKVHEMEGSSLVPNSSPRKPEPIGDTLDVANTVNSFAPHISEKPAIPSPSSLFPSSSSVNRREPTLSELRFLTAMETFRGFGDDMLRTFSIRLSAFREQIQDISKENIQKLKESAERTQTSDTWSLLKKIATSLLSALSIVLGTSVLIAGGPLIVGGAMIVSGILAIANTLMTETGAWNWVAKQLVQHSEEWQNRIALMLPIAVGILTWGIGLLGSGAVLAESGVDFWSKATLIAQTAFATFEGITAIGKGVADGRLVWSQADLIKLKSQMSIVSKQLDQSTKSIEAMFDGLNTHLDKARLFVKMAIRSNQAVVQS